MQFLARNRFAVLPFFQAADGLVDLWAGFLQIAQGNIVAKHAAACFDVGVYAVFAGDFGETFFCFQIALGGFDLLGVIGDDFADLHFVGVVVALFDFVVTLLHLGIGYGVFVDNVSRVNLHQQLVLVIRPLLFEVGLFVCALGFGLLHAFAFGIFVFFAFV